MRFIVVRDRAPRTLSACAHCAKPLELGYLRELASGSLYCHYACYRGRGGVVIPWSFGGSDNFALAGFRLAADFQRVFVDAYTK